MARRIHHASLIMQQSLAAKLALKYQSDCSAISTVYWMNIPQFTCKLLEIWAHSPMCNRPFYEDSQKSKVTFLPAFH